jgi:hypothetical protein
VESYQAFQGSPFEVCLPADNLADRNHPQEKDELDPHANSDSYCSDDQSKFSFGAQRSPARMRLSSAFVDASSDVVKAS